MAKMLLVFIVFLSFYCVVTIASRGVNLGGRGGTRPPQNLEWGTPMYNVPPDFDIFSVFFPYLELQRKMLYIVYCCCLYSR